MRFISEQPEATVELGKVLAKLLIPGMVLTLDGDLGTGKTVLSRGIARGLGITSPVTSPTFTVAQEYPYGDGCCLYHLDMYRIDDENSALAFGIDEFLFAANAVTIVEWPERIQGLLPEGKNLVRILLKHINEAQRSLEISQDFAERLIEAGLPQGLRLDKDIQE